MLFCLSFSSVTFVSDDGLAKNGPQNPICNNDPLSSSVNLLYVAKFQRGIFNRCIIISSFDMGNIEGGENLVDHCRGVTGRINEHL